MGGQLGNLWWGVYSQRPWKKLRSYQEGISRKDASRGQKEPGGRGTGPVLGIGKKRDLQGGGGGVGVGAESEMAEGGGSGVKGHVRAVFLAEAGKGRVPGKDGGAREGSQRLGWLGGWMGTREEG